jgi:hypothetical protein
MDREPLGTGRLPALGGCQATISSSIGEISRSLKNLTLSTPQPWRDDRRLGGWQFRYVTEYKGGSGGDQAGNHGSTVTWCPPL